MKTVLVLSTASFFLIVPCMLRAAMMARASPGQLAWFGMITLGGAAASFVALLGILIAPEVLPVTQFPHAVEICLFAIRDFFSHPFSHWLSIAAAVMLLTAILLLLWATASTAVRTRRCRLRASASPDEHADLLARLGEVPPGMRLLPTKQVVAFTTGFLHPQTIVSEGLLDALSAKERSAVVAHELAHARGRHASIVFLATVVARAFGFIPSVHVAVLSLLTALEARADHVAAELVGDPLVVAGALSSVARAQLRPTVAMGIAGGDVRYRLRRLTVSDKPPRPNGLAAILLCFSVVALLSQGAAWVIGSASLSRSIVAIELHHTCHTAHSPHTD